MKVSVKVPATTANIGPGFDCLGMALPIYNTITIEETVLPGTGVEINVLADNDSIDQLSLDHVPSDENSIVYKAVELLYNSIGQSPSELKINIHYLRLMISLINYVELRFSPKSICNQGIINCELNRNIFLRRHFVLDMAL